MGNNVHFYVGKKVTTAKRELDKPEQAQEMKTVLHALSSLPGDDQNDKEQSTEDEKKELVKKIAKLLWMELTICFPGYKNRASALQIRVGDYNYKPELIKKEKEVEKSVVRFNYEE